MQIREGFECPICNSKTTIKEYIENCICSESYEKCENGCYAEDFIYGHTEISFFGERSFQRHYADDEKKRRKTNKEIAEEIAYWLNDFKYLAKLMEYEIMHNMDRKTIRIKENFGAAYVSSQAVAKIKLEEF